MPWIPPSKEAMAAAIEVFLSQGEVNTSEDWVEQAEAKHRNELALARRALFRVIEGGAEKTPD